MKRCLILCVAMVAMVVGCSDDEEPLSIVGYWEIEGGGVYIAFFADHELCFPNVARPDSCFTGRGGCLQFEGEASGLCTATVRGATDTAHGDTLHNPIQTFHFRAEKLEPDRLRIVFQGGEFDTLLWAGQDPDMRDAEYNRIQPAQFPCDCASDTSTAAF